MRLNLNEIEQEITDSIADGEATRGLRSGSAIRVRTPGFGRGRRNASERDRSLNRPRQEKTKEGAI